MGTSSERVFNGSGKGYLPAGTIGNRTHILSERLKAGTEFKRLKKGHRPAPMPLKQTHILSYKPYLLVRDLKEKSPRSGSFLNQNGGGGGIRTLVTLYRPNGFRDRRIQPLCHPSAWGKNKAGSKACFGINWRRVRDLNPGDAFDAYTISNRAPSATRTTLR